MPGQTIYGIADLRPAIESIGATTRQLSYLVAKRQLVPAVQMPGRYGYSRDDLAIVFLMLGPLRHIALTLRRRVAWDLRERCLRGRGEDSEFIEVDLEDDKQNRCPAVLLKVDKQELKADFASFLGRAAGVPPGYGDAVSIFPVDLTGSTPR